MCDHFEQAEIENYNFCKGKFGIEIWFSGTSSI